MSSIETTTSPGRSPFSGWSARFARGRTGYRGGASSTCASAPMPAFLGFLVKHARSARRAIASPRARGVDASNQS